MIRRAQPWLGTLVEISVVDDEAPGEPRSSIAINAAFAAIALVHRTMSFHDPASDVSAINRLAVGHSIAVDGGTAMVLRCAAMLEETSAGIFNIACARQLAAWGFLPQGSAPVTLTPDTTDAPAPLQRAVFVIDADDQVRRTGTGWIDLGGIAKGYAVDTALATLQSHGIASGCVNAGGDLRAFGSLAFAVSVRDPRNPTRVGRTLELREQALATSACYFSRRDIDGVPHSALIDGTNGRPVVVQTSASVLAPSCMLADGLTKIVMASGDADHPLLARLGATAFII